MKNFILYLPLLFMTTSTHAERLSLQRGWNLVGADSPLTLTELKTKAGSDNLIVVQGQKKTYQKSYEDDGKDFLNNFTTFKKGRGYWIKVNSAVDVEYDKITYTTEENIDLIAGWNLINPPSDLNISEITTQLGANLEVIQGVDSTYQKVYAQEGKDFLNTLKKFEEPQGYWMKVNDAVTLHFPVASDTTSPLKPTLTNTPTSTTETKESIEVNGEVGATVWINGEKKGTVGSNGAVTVVLDTTGGEGRKTFSIVLRDANSNESEALILNIEKHIPDATAIRFLNKATFGANKKSIRELKEEGISSWLNRQLAMPNQPNHRHLRRTIALAKKFEPSNHPASIEEYLADNDTVFNKNVASFQMKRYQMSAWFETAMGDRDQLRNRVAYALSQIIVESLAEPIFTRRAEALSDYFDILTRNALGNYRDLLLEISHSSSMSLYLTFNGNRKNYQEGTTTIYPDENYAREIMQLFTIGLYQLNLDGTAKHDAQGNTIPTYTQEDITEVARLFTGWDIKRNRRYGRIGFVRGDLTHPVELTEEYHDGEEKHILGVTIPAGLGADEEMERFIDILMAHQNIAPFISKQLIMRLVKSNPSPAYVERVSEVFNDNGEGVKGDLKAVVKAIFLDPEFGNDIAPQKFKEPIIAWTQVLRAFNAQNYDTFKVKDKDFNITDAFFINAPNLGQSPSRAFSVFNFYDNDYIPNNDYFKSNGLVAPELQIQNDSVLIALNNYFAYNLKRQEKRHPNGWGNIGRDRYFVDCDEEYNLVEKELEGTVDRDFEPLNGVTRDNDTTADANGVTNRDRAVKAVIDLIDRKLTGSRTPQAKKELLFEHFKEAFYDRKLIRADDPELKIYENIIVPIVVAIATSEINMVE
jgi:uncharacterized protein (DUF1800 family)